MTLPLEGVILVSISFVVCNESLVSWREAHAHGSWHTDVITILIVTWLM